MEHNLHDHDEDSRTVTVAGRVNPRAEDSYWSDVFAAQAYYRAGLDSEDYAPAYCVGYIGFAQYGGEFDDAEKSLCANWERIRGDSRLSLDLALPAMRAAWNRLSTPALQPAAGTAGPVEVLFDVREARGPKEGAVLTLSS